MLRPGDKVKQRYAIVRVLSTGLLSVVYEAEDTAIRRRVVLKELAGGNERVSAARIEREVTLYSRLRHPQILELLDVMVENGSVYLVFPYIEGATLAEMIARGPVALPRALRIGEDVASAVAFIHRQGIIHRDLKPANVLVERDRAILADFGIAKDRAEEAGLALTQSGQTLGTPLYMAPEAIRNEPIGPAADVYALGVLLFETFAGVPPFTGRNFAELVANRLRSAPPSLQDVRPDLPPALAQLVRTMLDPDPAVRPTAEVVAEQLRALSHLAAAEAPEATRVFAPRLEGDPPLQPPLPEPALPWPDGRAAPPPSSSPSTAPAPPAPVRQGPPVGAGRWGSLAPAPRPEEDSSPPIETDLAKTVIVRDRTIMQTLQEHTDVERRGFFFDELARQDELKKSREFYRMQLSEDYGHLMFQAKVSFWLWVLFAFVGFFVLVVGIVLLYYGRWQEGAATIVSESIVIFIQKLFKDREDEFRERAAKKNRHVELGNLWNLAAQSLDGLDPATRREKLGKLTDALIAQVGAG